MTTLADVNRAGLASARPAAGVEGRFYLATDTGALFRDNGSTWERIGAGGSGQFVAVFDGGTDAITGHPDVDVVAPASGTISSWAILADTAGDAVIDVRKEILANFPPTGGDSIVASAPPTLSSATHASSASLTAWTTSVAAGDVLRFHLTSSATVKRLTVVLTYARS